MSKIPVYSIWLDHNLVDLLVRLSYKNYFPSNFIWHVMSLCNLYERKWWNRSNHSRCSRVPFILSRSMYKWLFATFYSIPSSLGDTRLWHFSLHDPIMLLRIRGWTIHSWMLCNFILKNPSKSCYPSIIIAHNLLSSTIDPFPSSPSYFIIITSQIHFLSSFCSPLVSSLVW